LGGSPTVIVVGAGHNGLVAATFLARAGARVRVLEEHTVIGGACRTEKPFARAPHLAASTGAYLLGLMPPELVAKLGIDLPLVRRDPHYFLPTTGDSYLMFGTDRTATKEQFLRFFSEQDYRANEAMQAEIADLRSDLAPTWLSEPLSIEDTAERHVRATLRATFVALCRGSIGSYLARFDFKSDLLRAMYAVTDGFSGLHGTWSTPGTGMNFLIHNMCRLPGADGTWMIVRGGMGTVTARIAEAARLAGASIETDRRVERLVVEGGTARGVVLEGGAFLPADAVVCNADPFRMRDLVARGDFPETYHQRIDGYRRNGTTMKVNLALRAMPEFTCLVRSAESVRHAALGAFGPTVHLLPDERDVIASLEQSYADVKAGRLPEFPTIEWYMHTSVDPTLTDEEGRHSGALFVQWVPYELSGGKSWDTEQEPYVRHLLSICDRFAPGTSDLVVDTFTLTPPGIEKHFGITRGHIHHVDNGFGFADRLPYRTPAAGLYSCSAGTHPAGSVIGCAGHNAARCVMDDLGLDRGLL